MGLLRLDDGDGPAEPAAGVRAGRLGLDVDLGNRPTCRPEAGPRRGLGSVRSIRTGMRWTTLTKLPVAFSGGSIDEAAPVAGANPETRPRTTRPG